VNDGSRGGRDRTSRMSDPNVEKRLQSLCGEAARVVHYSGGRPYRTP
jgi:hypothetical protein